METSLYSFYLKAPEIENPYYETKTYKFSEKVVTAQDDSADEKPPSTLTIDDVALKLDSRIDDVALKLDSRIDDVALKLDSRYDDVALRLDKLTHLVEKIVDAS